VLDHELGFGEEFHRERGECPGVQRSSLPYRRQVVQGKNNVGIRHIEHDEDEVNWAYDARNELLKGNGSHYVVNTRIDDFVGKSFRGSGSNDLPHGCEVAKLVNNLRPIGCWLNNLRDLPVSRLLILLFEPTEKIPEPSLLKKPSQRLYTPEPSTVQLLC